MTRTRMSDRAYYEAALARLDEELKDDPDMDAMGRIMRLVHEATVTAVSQGRWAPKPIAEAILAELTAARLRGLESA